jgi:hypothetical protein
MKRNRAQQLMKWTKILVQKCNEDWFKKIVIGLACLSSDYVTFYFILFKVVGFVGCILFDKITIM